MVFTCTKKPQFKKQVTYNVYKRSYADLYHCKCFVQPIKYQWCIKIPVNAQFLLLLLHELSVDWYFNTSLAFKWLSNKDIRTAVYSMSDFLRTCTGTMVFMHRRLLLDQHSCHSKHPSSFEGAEMFPTFLLTNSFLLNGLRRLYHNQSMCVKPEDIVWY